MMTPPSSNLSPLRSFVGPSSRSVSVYTVADFTPCLPLTRLASVHRCASHPTTVPPFLEVGPNGKVPKPNSASNTELELGLKSDTRRGTRRTNTESNNDLVH